MSTSKKEIISIRVHVKAPIDFAWKCWTNPDDIIHWNYASEDWQTPWAKNSLHEGGRFVYRMEAKDGSMGFDFGGTYQKIVAQKQLIFLLDDGRIVEVRFSETENATLIEEDFEAENANPTEMQRNGWQAILANFKKYTEEKFNS